MTPPATAPAANNLEAFFMPFTANRQFKKNPRLLARAKGVHYWTPEGRKVIDGTAGLWCVNAGHGREEIKQAIVRQLEEMDYAPSFQMGHPKSFELAARHAAMLPGDLDHAFYCNSGSEAVDFALKIALAWQRARGQGTRTRLIGRERGYHGVGFGGISVGGARLLRDRDHGRHPRRPRRRPPGRGAHPRRALGRPGRPDGGHRLPGLPRLRLRQRARARRRRRLPGALSTTH